VLVRDVMSATPCPIDTARTDERAMRAAHRLSLSPADVLLVVTPTGRAVGLLSDRDVLEALVRPGSTFDELDVVDVMRRLAVACSPVDTAGDVFDALVTAGQRVAPVIEDGSVTGVVTIDELVELRALDRAPSAYAGAA
jgi:CBS domain-containing protein